MRYFSSVLVALDGSPPSAAALDVACSILCEHDGTLVGCHIVEPVPMMRGRHVQWVPEPPDSRRREAIALLRDAREQAQREYGISLETMLVDGNPVDEILHIARTKGVDTIVIGSHSRTGMQRWLLGSVAEGVMRGSAVPVLVVHSVAPVAERKGVGAS